MGEIGRIIIKPLMIRNYRILVFIALDTCKRTIKMPHLIIFNMSSTIGTDFLYNIIVMGFEIKLKRVRVQVQQAFLFL